MNFIIFISKQHNRNLPRWRRTKRVIFGHKVNEMNGSRLIPIERFKYRMTLTKYCATVSRLEVYIQIMWRVSIRKGCTREYENKILMPLHKRDSPLRSVTSHKPRVPEAVRELLRIDCRHPIGSKKKWHTIHLQMTKFREETRRRVTWTGDGWKSNFNFRIIWGAVVWSQELSWFNTSEYVCISKKNVHF